MFALSIKNRRDDMIRRQAAKKLSCQSKRSISAAVNRSQLVVMPNPPKPTISRSNSDNQLTSQNEIDVLQVAEGRSISVAGPQYVPEIDQLELESIGITRRIATVEHKNPKIIRRRATFHSFSPLLCLFGGRKKSKHRRKIRSSIDKTESTNDQKLVSDRQAIFNSDEMLYG